MHIAVQQHKSAKRGFSGRKRNSHETQWQISASCVVNRQRPRPIESALASRRESLLSYSSLCTHSTYYCLENEEEVWGGLTSGHFSGPPTGPGRVPRSDAGLPGRRGLSARRPDQAHVSAAPDGPVLGLQSDGVHVVLRAPISLLSFCFFSGRSSLSSLSAFLLPTGEERRRANEQRARSAFLALLVFLSFADFLSCFNGGGRTTTTPPDRALLGAAAAERGRERIPKVVTRHQKRYKKEH